MTLKGLSPSVLSLGRGPFGGRGAAPTVPKNSFGEFAKTRYPLDFTNLRHCKFHSPVQSGYMGALNYFDGVKGRIRQENEVFSLNASPHSNTPSAFLCRFSCNLSSWKWSSLIPCCCARLIQNSLHVVISCVDRGPWIFSEGCWQLRMKRETHAQTLRALCRSNFSRTRSRP